MVWQVDVQRLYVGNFMTALNMAGLSLSLLHRIVIQFENELCWLGRWMYSGFTSAIS